MTETELLTLARPTIHKAYMSLLSVPLHQRLGLQEAMAHCRDFLAADWNIDPETVQEACELVAHDNAQKRLNQ